MQSYWSAMYAGPNHGVFIKKLERLGRIRALEIERERFFIGEDRIEHASFLVKHVAVSWQDLHWQVLEVARIVFPVWKVTLGKESLTCETGPDVSALTGYTQRITGHRLLKVEANAAQYYSRMRWLSGQPDRW